ncbi:hypothetical protein [Rhodovulum kholense]|uniref:hypothetical protein n=1 Tax=Rhodovulum kholense TaxID=453584 RepID=UPI000D34B3AA|nr:hypothetical protein [Rhodovulum kholense]
MNLVCAPLAFVTERSEIRVLILMVAQRVLRTGRGVSALQETMTVAELRAALEAARALGLDDRAAHAPGASALTWPKPVSVRGAGQPMGNIPIFSTRASDIGRPPRPSTGAHWPEIRSRCVVRVFESVPG